MLKRMCPERVRVLHSGILPATSPSFLGPSAILMTVVSPSSVMVLLSSELVQVPEETSGDPLKVELVLTEL